jgi:eukaryotic-like serine/threonine-protein kinase
MTVPTLTADVCPSREVLAAWARGELPPEDFEGVADHVAGCPRCEPALGNLDEADRFLACLRDPLPVLFPDEPGCARLEERGRALGPGGPGAATRSAFEETLSRQARTDAAVPLDAFGYALQERLGGGGMGVVYKAVQKSVNRLVAVKMIRAADHADEEALARFRTEGAAIARLCHPHVIQLYEFGDRDGQPFFSMEYAAGGSLAGRLKGRPLAVREAAELVRVLALAIEAAHREHIIHRDLKPANVLLMADGTPKVGDFGLAKLLDSDSGHTQTGVVMGTAAYMAPEQAAGRVRDHGPAVDVWALGIILYECLTGRTPFQGEDREATLEGVRTREPERPSRLRPEVTRDLEAVCLKCLEKDPARRYPTAASLAGDLGRWLEGRPVGARLRRWYERAWQGPRSRPLLSAAVLLVLLSAAAAPFALDRLGADYPRKRAERLLARGKPFVWEWPDELPGSFRPVLGDASPPKPNPREGCAIVETLGTGLVEVVRDPGCDSYQLLVEMRHDSGLGSQVGLYFGYREGPVRPDSRLASYCTLIFADRGSLAQVEHDAGGNPVSRVRLEHRCFAEDLDRRLHPHQAIGKGKPFRPEGPPGLSGPWRTLLLEVRPDSVEGLWVAADGTRETVEKVSTQYLRDRLAVQKQVFQLPEELPTDFQPRAGLGLYVQQGKVSVRRVVVAPLTGDGKRDH